MKAWAWVRQFGWLAVVVLTLSGCSTRTLPPDEVLQRLAAASADLKSFDYDITLELAGKLPVILGSQFDTARLRLTGELASQDFLAPQFTLRTDITAGSGQGSLALSGQLVGLADYTYFKLTDLAVPTLLPVSLGADSRWYRIKQSNYQSGNNVLGTLPAQALTPAQISTLHDLVKNAVLFDVRESLPDETASGQRSYHYRVTLRPDDLKYLLTRVSETTGSALPIDLGQAADYTADLWVNKRSFQMSRLRVSDTYLADGVPVAFTLELGLMDHNERVNVTAPNAAEELNRQNLLDKLAHWQPTF